MYYPMSASRSSFHRARFVVGLILVTVGIARVAEAQRVVRPRSLWGRVHENAEGFGFGGVELLATLTFALMLLCLVAAWQCARAVVLSRQPTLHHSIRMAVRHQLERRGTLLAVMTYLATPAVGLAAIVLAPSREIFGAQIVTWMVCMAAAGVSLGAVALLLDHGSRRRLDL